MEGLTQLTLAIKGAIRGHSGHLDIGQKSPSSPTISQFHQLFPADLAAK